MGEAKRRWKDRFNDQPCTIENPNNKPEPNTATEHFFSSPKHTVNYRDAIIPYRKYLSRPRLYPLGQESYLNSKRKNNWYRWSEHPRRNILIVLFYYVILLFYFTICLSLITLLISFTGLRKHAS